VKEKKKLKILLASCYPFTGEPGGVKDFILGLKEALEKHNCKVVVIAPGSKDAKTKGLVDFVLGIGIKVATDQTKFWASLSRKETATKILEEVKPDIIVIHEPFLPSVGHTIISSVAKNKNKIKPIIVGQFHSSREELNWWLKSVEFVVRHFLRWPKLDRKTILGLSPGYVSTINNNLDGRIAVSQATRKFWQKKLPADYRVIYNGIDTKRLTVKIPKIKSRKKNGEKVILFAGRHDPRKGIGDLISAFGILVNSGHKNLRLKITGKGETTRDLKKKVARMGLRKLVKFVGVLPHPRLIQAYRTADLLVAPSIGGEGFNRTIIEARSCGTLVVCTDIAGQNEAIGKDLFSFMAKPKNPRNLADQIMTVLNLPESEKQKIRLDGRRDVVSHFDWDIIIKKHLEYYRGLLRQS
jgi:glycosyltransferase involved in cell wall biosynthesis